MVSFCLTKLYLVSFLPLYINSSHHFVFRCVLLLSISLYLSLSHCTFYFVGLKLKQAILLSYSPRYYEVRLRFNGSSTSSHLSLSLFLFLSLSLSLFINSSHHPEPICIYCESFAIFHHILYACSYFIIETRYELCC